MKKKMNRKKSALLFFGIVLLLIVIKIFCNFFTKPIQREWGSVAETDGKDDRYRMYYVLNIDGMKGLGHSALLLQDAEGNAEIFSYNGMQYNLIQCLVGKAGIGKMQQISMDADGLALFLETGDVKADSPKECDNFDRAIYCDITAKQYHEILQRIRFYMDVGDEFERLYAEAPDETAAFVNRADIPKYQIYTHNCDTVARELMALASDEAARYNQGHLPLTPGGSYRKMVRRFGSDWGIMKLGEDSFTEKLLSNY